MRNAEAEVLELYTYFKLENREAQRGMRDYTDKVKACGEKSRPPKDLKPLLQAANTLVVSTADCEGSFSQMNISGMRATLQLRSESALISIKSIGPSVKHAPLSPKTLCGVLATEKPRLGKQLLGKST